MNSAEASPLHVSIGLYREPSPETTETLKSLAGELLLQLDNLVETMHTGIDQLRAVPLLEPPTRLTLTTSTRAIAEGWLSSMAVSPGKVPPDVPWEMFHLARVLWSSGHLTESDFRAAFHLGQNAGWQIWQRVLIERISDPAVLAEAIELSAASMFEYVQGLSDAIVRQMQLEFAASAGGEDHRLANVRLVLHGSFSEAQASRHLGYELSATHTCMIVSGRGSEPIEGDCLAERLTKLTNASATFHACTPDGSLWIWFANCEELETTGLSLVLEEADATAAIGDSQPGLPGFRRSFETAASVQALMRNAPRERIVATHREAALVTLAGYNQFEATRFIKATLNGLADDSASVEDLRQTMRVYLQEGENAARAAERLHAHRNTIHYRIARAQELIGDDFRERRLEIAAALELADWFGVGGGRVERQAPT